MSQAVIITHGEVPTQGRHAVPVTVDNTRPAVGPAQNIIILPGAPRAGGPALAVRDVSGQGIPGVGPALPVYVVGGVLDTLAYTRQVQTLAGAALIAYWPLAESGGTAITDASGNGHAGTASNVALGAPGIGDGRTAARFNGTSSVVNVFSAGLAAAFSGVEGTIAAWCRVGASGVWGDSTIRRAVTLSVNAQNRILLQKNSAAGQLIPNYVAANVGKSQTQATTTLAWFHLATTWSAAGDTVAHYFNGALITAALHTLGAWAGALAVAAIGANDLTPTSVWSGDIAHVVLCNAALAPATIAALATIPREA